MINFFEKNTCVFKLSPFIFFTALFLFTGSACKKDKKSEENNGEIKTPDDKTSGTGSRFELTQDSIFLYARQIYLWWDKVPDYNTFKPRDYRSAKLSAKETDHLDAELYAITRFGTNPSTNKPYEFDGGQGGKDSGYPKYSYISDITERNPVAVIPARRSSVNLEGDGYDFGLNPVLVGEPTRYFIVLQSVYPNSDAASKGLVRGDIIEAIDGRTVGSNYNNEVDYINDALFDASSVTIKVKKRIGGAVVNLTLNRNSYKSSPIYKDSVYTAGSKKIGYMAYARFTNLSNSSPEFNRVFSKFASQGVTDLIVDLRYNGGGYVSTAENLINLIAPGSLNGKVMYTEHFNQLMQEGKAAILGKQPILNSFDQPQYSDGKLQTYLDVDYSVQENTYTFSKTGPLNNLSSVVFIVSENTASASELVINSLKPYMKVAVVGETSYGKPVGFFPVRIDKYDVFFSMFETKNSKEEGGYYQGIVPDTRLSQDDDDDLTAGFGDLNERSFKAAYNYITKGTFTSAKKETASVLSTSKTLKVLGGGSESFGGANFKGMIEDRLKFKK